MTRSDQLRQALDSQIERTPPQQWVARRTIDDAARLALQVWEGDEQLVEKVSNALFGFDWVEPTGVRGRYDRMARAVLAAITEEEKK